jgi:hypothetical protein
MLVSLGRCWRRAVVGLAGLTVAPLFVVGSANGQTLEWTDPTGDMWNSYLDPWHPAPGRTLGDGQQARVRHSPYALTLRNWFAATKFPAGGVGELDVRAKIRTNEGRLSIEATKGLPVRLYDDTAGIQVACRNLRWTWDDAAASLYIRVPRNCMNRPRWVRVASETLNVIGDNAWMDDLHGSGQAPGTGLAPDNPLFQRFSSRVWRQE